jgi:hypothetical protein
MKKSKRKFTDKFFSRRGRIGEEFFTTLLGQPDFKKKLAPTRGRRE